MKDEEGRAVQHSTVTIAEMGSMVLIALMLLCFVLLTLSNHLRRRLLVSSRREPPLSTAINTDILGTYYTFYCSAEFRPSFSGIFVEAQSPKKVLSVLAMA